LGLLFSLQPQDHIFQLVTITQGLVLSISFFVLSSYILVNPSILIGLSLVKYNAPPTSLSKERAPRPNEIENIETSVRIVEDYMRSSKAYLNPNLTLAIVSVEVDIATKELSHLINNYYKIRFTDFVNQYRIGYFMDLINTGKLDDYTIEALIKTAGFTSKSSFHSAFKKIHNCTPSQYIAAQKANLSA
jgi:AraC-like DNA-binding protein